MWSHITTMQRAFFTLQLLWVSIATECLCSLNLAFMLPPLSCQCKSSFTQHMNRRWKFNLQILFVFGLALHLASGFVYVHVYVNMLNCSFSNAWGHTHLLELQPVCRYGLYIWHFTQTNCVTCCRNAVAVYTIHGLGPCISKQGKYPDWEKQNNGVPHIFGCDVVYNTVRNSR